MHIAKNNCLQVRSTVLAAALLVKNGYEVGEAIQKLRDTRPRCTEWLRTGVPKRGGRSGLFEATIATVERLSQQKLQPEWEMALSSMYTSASGSACGARPKASNKAQA